jgi:branched-chain amino acid transport system permease protein
MWEAGNILVGGLLTGGIYALLAVGFTLIFSVSGILNLAQGAFVTLGALVMYSLITTVHLPLPLAFPGAVILVGAVAAEADWLIVRPAQGRLSRTNLLILMAGFLTFFQGAAFLLWGSNLYSLPPFSGQEPVKWGGLFIPTQGFWVVAVSTAITLTWWWILSKTLFGKALQACAENPVAARLMGIKVDRMVLFAFTASGLMGAIVGAVIVPLTSLDFTSMANYTNQGLIAVTVGGIGSFFGSAVGGVVEGLFQQFISGYVSSIYSTSLSMAILVLILVFRPQGILGRVRGARADVQDRVLGREFVAPRLSRRTTAVTIPLLSLLMLGLPYFLTGTGYLRAVNIAGIFCLVILGLDLLTGVAGQVSLGQAAFMAIGGYTAAILVLNYHQGAVLGILAGVLLSLAVALLLALASFRIRGMYLAISTLAFGILIESLGNGLNITGGPSGLSGIPGFTVGGYTFSTDFQYYYLIWGLVAVSLFLLANLLRSNRGRALRSMRNDQTGAQALGVNTAAHKIQVFLISAALASVAGSLYAFFFHYLSPGMVGSQTSLTLMTMLVVGGAGTLVGPIIGVVLLTFFPEVSKSMAAWAPMVEGVLMIVFLSYLPGGLYGELLQLAQRLGRRSGEDRESLAKRGVGLG